MIKHVLWLALLPGAAFAADDFAKQWPLQLQQADGGAYRVPLNADIYATAHWRDLRDVRVLDADGKLVASAVYAAAPMAIDTRTVDLKWFALPTGAQSAGSGLDVVVQRDSAGNVISIRNAVGVGASAAIDPAWLIDLGKEAASLRSLIVDWADTAQALDLAYRVEGSNDLRDWQVVVPEARLVQLHNQGQALREARIELSTSTRYLRVVPLQRSGAPALRALRGEMSSAVTNDWQWQTLQLLPGGDAKNGYEYQLAGRFPVQRLDVLMPNNSTAVWQVSSRDADQRLPNGDQADWSVLASAWNAWSLSEAGTQQTSPSLVLNDLVNDRQWRLRGTDGNTSIAAPQLRAGYRPGSVVFLAQGRAPYLLVAGSANISAPQAELAPMLNAQRARSGAQWQPAAALLGAPSVRAGDAAYQPAAKPKDWKSLLLWAVLIVGAVVVTGFAVSLLRGNREQGKAD